jgi:bacteriocin-like protein
MKNYELGSFELLSETELKSITGGDGGLGTGTVSLLDGTGLGPLGTTTVALLNGLGLGPLGNTAVALLDGLSGSGGLLGGGL